MGVGVWWKREETILCVMEKQRREENNLDQVVETKEANLEGNMLC